jgi:formate dehydrogenase major subunit
MSRHVPWLRELFASHFAEIGPELAGALAIRNGDVITVETPRAKITVRAMVTERIKALVIDGKKVHQVGIPWSGGTNDLLASLGDPTSYSPESRALLCNVRKGAG